MISYFRAWFNRSASLFFVLGAVLWPFPYQLLPVHFELVQWLYQGLPFADDSALALSSDSVALWQWIATLGALALLFGMIWTYLSRGLAYGAKALPWLRLLGIYFLTFALFKYGFNKVFKWQFYLPEPNILYTPFGQLDPDILFWSSMGISYGYNLFLGLLEVIPAVLLLGRRTRLPGLLLALPVLVHILAINFFFDISVKALSLFLVGLCLWSLAPYGTYLGQVLLGRNRGDFPQELYPQRTRAGTLAKLAGLVLLLAEVLCPYWQIGNFQDDLAPRPPLHGAYELVGQSQTWPIGADSLELRRLFVHRSGYLIVQTTTDQMVDYPLRLDRNRNEWQLTDPDGSHYRFTVDRDTQDSWLWLQFVEPPLPRALPLHVLDWQALPALNGDFHWVVE